MLHTTVDSCASHCDILCLCSASDSDGYLEHVGVLPAAFPHLAVVKCLNSVLILRRKN